MTSITKSPRLMATREATGDGVLNDAGENLGKIEDFVVDLDHGRIAYAVLSFGGFLGMGNKWFAVPWEALERLHDKKFLLKVDKEVLKKAPGFEKGERPDFENREWAAGVHTHYGYTPYWLVD